MKVSKFADESNAQTPYPDNLIGTSPEKEDQGPKTLISPENEDQGLITPIILKSPRKKKRPKKKKPQIQIIENLVPKNLENPENPT
jgi:hypothetical protein